MADTVLVQAEAAPVPIRKAASAGAIWIAAEMVGVQAISIGVFSVIAHYVRPAEFGMMGLAYALIYSLKTVFIDNIATYISRRREPLDFEYSTCFWITAASGILCAVIMGVAAEALGHLFSIESSASIIVVSSPIIFFMALGKTHEVYLSKKFAFRSLALRGIVGAAGGGLVGIFAAVEGFGVYALVFQQIVGAILILFLLWIVTPWRPSIAFSLQTAAGIGALAKTTCLTSLAYLLSQNGDVFFVTYRFGLNVTGFYSAAKRLRLAVTMVTTSPINGVTLPALASAQDNSERLKHLFIKGLMLLSATSIPMYFGAAAISSQLLSLLVGSTWLPAAPILSLMLISAFFSSMTSYYEYFLLVSGLQKWILYASAANTTILFCLFLVVPIFPTYLVALPAAVPHAGVFFVLSALIGKKANISYWTFFNAVGSCIFCAVLMYAAIYFARQRIDTSSTQVQLLVLIPTGVVVYGVAMAIFSKKHCLMFIELANEFLRGNASL